jgi:hypothetical protein
VTSLYRMNRERKKQTINLMRDGGEERERELERDKTLQ